MSKTSINLAINEHQIQGYERVVEFKGENLHAIIVLHNTKLGPALGGIRAYPYASFEQGLEDVLRLAKGMTYKAASAKTGTGGGKSIIFLNSNCSKSDEMLRSFAEAVNYFEGNYICAEDIGICPTDLGVICQETRYAVGLPIPKSSGDPSRFTAYGGFRGIQAVCKKLWGTESLEGKICAIQGLGAVGMRVAQHLFWSGARLIVADTNQLRVNQAINELGATAVDPEEILSSPCDIFVPCALGGILNSTTIPQLRCKGVAGLANNQLLSDRDGDLLFERGILYAPDYVINGGGLIAVCVEIEPGGFDPNTARRYLDRIYDQLSIIFRLSEEQQKPTHLIANELAEHHLKHGIGRRTSTPCFQC
jgi:leucine dehydrogenase